MISGYPSPISFPPPVPSIYAGAKTAPAVFNPYPPSSQQTLAPFSKYTTLKSRIQSYPVISLLLALIGGLGTGYLSHRYSLLTKLASVFKPASKPIDNIESIEDMEELFRLRYPDRGLYNSTITQNYRNMPEICYLEPIKRILAIDDAKYKDLKEHGIQYFDELYRTPPNEIFRRHTALKKE
ncbi:hypothetical protein [Vampirovibrio sp.]|uniref:hypothetical protein n=1 Tax=Vampirovibrio sp. TaxID=2717857 RepID=UPI00359491D7